MTNFNEDQSAEPVSNRAIVFDYGPDLPTLVRQVRLCRSTLGAILDELERGDHTATSIERLTECTTSVTAEIETLWEAIKQSHQEPDQALKG